MSDKRKIEIFSAGCEVCNDAVSLIKKMDCPSCEITVLDMQDQEVSKRAKSLGINSVPAVVIDGKLSDCCKGRCIDEAAIRAACAE